MRNFFLSIRFLFFLAFISILSSCTNKKLTAVKPAIIPAPLSQVMNDGTFILDNTTGIQSAITEFKSVAEFLKLYIEEGSTIALADSNYKTVISFKKDASNYQ